MKIEVDLDLWPEDADPPDDWPEGAPELTPEAVEVARRSAVMVRSWALSGLSVRPRG